MTRVGVDDPYEHVDRCDHLTDDGRCRLALATPERDPEFAAGRARAEYACVAADPEAEWSDCAHFQSTTDARECRRCGLTARPDNHSDANPLLEEHHLAYRDGETGQEITVALCRWCHAKVHESWARIDDDASPDPDAVATAEERRGQELDEAAFETAAERFED
jgi:hypothetical protein